MPLRPANARWFELLIAREQLEITLRALANTGQVELQAHGGAVSAHLLPQLRTAVDEYHHLAQTYRIYWPAPARPPSSPERALEEVPRNALARLHAWAAAAASLVARLQQQASQQAELEEVESLLRADTTLPDLALLDRAGPSLAGRIYRLEPTGTVPDVPPAVLAVELETEEQRYLLILGEVATMAALDEVLAAHKARRLRLPQGLPAGREAMLQEIAQRKEALGAVAQHIRVELAQLGNTHEVGGALADLSFAEWLLQHVPEMTVTERFGWITGWTSASSESELQAALVHAGVPHVLRFPTAPADITSRPVVLRNPRWARPFELFERLVGTPQASEADPSVILALIVPLMFGFMFGDVGQGAVLLLAGILLRRRFRPLVLLIPGGFAAMVFGVLFGSVFAREDLIHALWLRPLSQPLVPLAVSLAFGAGLLVLGLLLDGLQHRWAGQSRLWWRTRAGLLLAYLGMLGVTLDMRALWVVAAGLLWFWAGSSVGPDDRLGRLGSSIAESIEVLLQLFVNTLSFVRIGAFALAHAGLAAAIQALAAGVQSRLVALILLALGNLAVIVIEGLIVGIQTTRLVLFEFFIRFLSGTGRQFRPLPPPELPTPPRGAGGSHELP
jgi:V/A-type H+-transporting ATPase subunit I